MRRALVLALLGSCLAAPAWADMYPDASNVVLPDALLNLKIPGIYAAALGVKCDAVSDDKQALQDAVDYVQKFAYPATNNGGGVLWLPPGFCFVSDRVRITSGISIFGTGTGLASGNKNSGGTVIRTTNATSDVFTVETDGSVVFDNFTIDSSVAKTSGAAISLAGANPGTTNIGSRISRMFIGANSWDGVYGGGAYGWTVTESRFHGGRHNNITVAASPAFPDGTAAGIKIVNNAFYNLTTGSTCRANIEVNGGGAVHISNNKFKGCFYNVLLNSIYGPTGTLLISNNGMEDTQRASIALIQGATGSEYANVAIIGNELSVLATDFPNSDGMIYIGPGTPTNAVNWLRNVNIIGNHTNNGVPMPQGNINIQGGAAVVASGNVLDGNNAPTSTGFSVGPGASNVTIGADNVYQRINGGPFGAMYWPAVNIPLSPAPNLLLNGSMAIDQIHEGTPTAVSLGAQQYCTDGWMAQILTTSGVTGTCERSTVNPPSDGTHSLLYTVGAAGATGAGDFARVVQRIESNNLVGLGFGSADAKTLTVSYSLRSSVAGTYTFNMINGATNNRIFRDSCTVPAGTWARCVHVIPGDVTGAWTLSGSGSGLWGLWVLNAGSSVNAGVNRTWGGTNAQLGVPGQANINESAGATWQLANAKLEVSKLPTPYTAPAMPAEILRAQRYYWKSFPTGTAPAQNAGIAGARCVRAAAATAGALSSYLQFPAPMNASPTVVTYNPAAANANWRNMVGASDAAVQVDSAAAKSAGGVMLGQQTTALTAGADYCIHATADSRL